MPPPLSPKQNNQKELLNIIFQYRTFLLFLMLFSLFSFLFIMYRNKKFSHTLIDNVPCIPTHIKFFFKVFYYFGQCKNGYCSYRNEYGKYTYSFWWMYT